MLGIERYCLDEAFIEVAASRSLRKRLSKELRPTANNFSLDCLKIQRTSEPRGFEEFPRAERAGNISWETYCYLSSVFEVVFLKGFKASPIQGIQSYSDSHEN